MKTNDIDMAKEFDQIVQNDINILKQFLDNPQEVELKEEEYSAIMRLACCGMTFMESILILEKNPEAIVRGQDAPWAIVDFEVLQKVIAVTEKPTNESLLYMPDGLSKVMH